MKKLILLVATIIMGSVASAQVVPGFSIGPKIGASFSKFTTDQDQIKEEVKNTFYFGAFARFGKKIYVQPELLIMSRKGTLKDDANAGSTGSIKINTIDIPMLLGYKILDLKAVNARVMAGPVASLVIDKTITFDETWNDDISFTGDDVRKTNWGLQFGAGVDVLFLTLDLRYEIGLNNISELSGFDLKNNMFTVGLGWKIL